MVRALTGVPFSYFVGLAQIYFKSTLPCLVLKSNAKLLTSKYEKHTTPIFLKNFLKTCCKKFLIRLLILYLSDTLLTDMDNLLVVLLPWICRLMA